MNRNLGHSITMTVGAGGSGSQGGHSSSGSGGAYVGSGGGTSGVSSSHNYRSDLMWKATVNLANSIVGVSLLSMPYVLKKAGLALGLLCILTCAYFTYITCKFLARSACATRRRSFQYLALFTNGVAGKTAVELSVIGLNIGSCVAFFVVIGDVSSEFLSRYVVSENLDFWKNVILVCLATIVVLPLALVRDIGSFANLSTFSLTFYLIFTFYVFFAFTTTSGLDESSVKNKEYPIEWFNLDGVFEVAPIIAGSFTCQPALFPVMNLLEDDTPKSIEKVTRRSIAFVAFIYCSVGLFGYLMFGESSLGDMLHNFERTTATDVIKIAFALSVLFSFPLVVYPLRSSLETLLFQNTSNHHRKTRLLVSDRDYESGSGDDGGMLGGNGGSGRSGGGGGIDMDGSGHPVGGVYIPAKRFMKMTFFIVASTLTTGILIPHVEKILAFSGSTAGMLISLILPACIYLRTLPKGNPSMAKVILACGFILMLVGTLNVLSSSSSDPITELLYEKSLRRPEMLKIDEAIKEDWRLKQQQMEEEEKKIAKEEEELKNRKEDLEKRKEALESGKQMAVGGVALDPGGEDMEEKTKKNKDEAKAADIVIDKEEKEKSQDSSSEREGKKTVEDDVSKKETSGEEDSLKKHPASAAEKDKVDGDDKKEEGLKAGEDQKGVEAPVHEEWVMAAPEDGAGKKVVKTQAEDGLLKQLKETQQLQEKLMEHQNQLINKLEGGHDHEGAGAGSDSEGDAAAKAKDPSFVESSQNEQLKSEADANENLERMEKDVEKLVQPDNFKFGNGRESLFEPSKSEDQRQLNVKSQLNENLQPGGAQQNMQPGGDQQNMQPGGAQQNMQPGGAQQNLQPGGVQQHMQPGFREQIIQNKAVQNLQPGIGQPKLQNSPGQQNLQPNPNQQLDLQPNLFLQRAPPNNQHQDALGQMPNNPVNVLGQNGPNMQINLAGVPNNHPFNGIDPLDEKVQRRDLDSQMLNNLLAPLGGKSK